MNEFKEKVNSSELVWNAIVKIDHNKANVGLLVEAIRTVFKDWQPPPPKELVKVKPFVAEWFETNKEDLYVKRIVLTMLGLILLKMQLELLIQTIRTVQLSLVTC